MRRRTLIAILTAGALVFCQETRSRSRSVIPVPDTKQETPATFDWKQSAALFVGIREFRGADVPVPVPYAVDDAIDLAWTFAFDKRVELVPAQKIVLALSGEPVKEQSRARLAQLLTAGATTAEATRGDILRLLERQTAATGERGMLIVSFATHGFITGGTAYVLGATSAFTRVESALSSTTIFDIAGRARRSLILIDACRDPAPTGARAARTSGVDAELLIRRRTPIRGQAVLYAPRFAFDDHVRQNGVFTKAVLDGLNCKAARRRGAITIETLATFVNREVERWLRKHRPYVPHAGIQKIIDGSAMPLSLSVCAKPLSSRPPAGPARVTIANAAIAAFDRHGKPLWQRELASPVLRAEAADLDADGANDVIAATANRIHVFDANGTALWSAATSAPLRTFLTADLYDGPQRHIVALLQRRIVVYEPDGKVRAEREHARELQHLAIDRPTSHHDRRIIVATSTGEVFLLNPNKLASAKAEWYGSVLPHAPIRELTIVDADNDARRDIALRTDAGRVVLTFAGAVLESDGVQFVPLAQ